MHPMGLFDVRQHAVPLETAIVRVGANPVPEGQRRVHLGVPLVDGTPAGALSEVTDLFSAGNFLDLTDDQKLSRPSFEPMPAGARIRPPGEKVTLDDARQADLRYETFVCDEDGGPGRAQQARARRPVREREGGRAGGRRGGPHRPAGAERATRPTPIRSSSPAPARCWRCRSSRSPRLPGPRRRPTPTRRRPRSPPTCSSPAWGSPDGRRHAALAWPGEIFKTADVISALHAPLKPEALVLNRYVFLPLRAHRDRRGARAPHSPGTCRRGRRWRCKRAGDRRPRRPRTRR